MALRVQKLALTTLFTPLIFACAVLAGSSNASAQTYEADVPDSIKTPDVIETERLGTLRFFDGMPDEETVNQTVIRMNRDTLYSGQSLHSGSRGMELMVVEDVIGQRTLETDRLR